MPDSGDIPSLVRYWRKLASKWSKDRTRLQAVITLRACAQELAAEIKKSSDEHYVRRRDRPRTNYPGD